MTGRINNEYGNIVIENDVVAKVASQAATECYGVVGMASKSKTTGIVELLMNEHKSKGVKVIVEEENVYITIYVVVQYGTKISEVANSMIDRVKYMVEKFTGLKVKKIDINIQGVRVSK
ncbi:Asp23/Gls24 family envelope stress response protein [Peptostreptococcaceae bacterium AGR-M142]